MENTSIPGALSCEFVTMPFGLNTETVQETKRIKFIYDLRSPGSGNPANEKMKKKYFFLLTAPPL
jgi:hypothetical protein